MERVVCKNFWCKGTFLVDEAQLEIINRRICPKCISFDTELSGGVSFTENKEYPGERFDDSFHQMDIKVKKYGE